MREGLSRSDPWGGLDFGPESHVRIMGIHMLSLQSHPLFVRAYDTTPPFCVWVCVDDAQLHITPPPIPVWVNTVDVRYSMRCLPILAATLWVCIRDEVHITTPVTLWECTNTCYVTTKRPVPSVFGYIHHTYHPCPPFWYVYVINDSSLPSLDMHTTYMTVHIPSPAHVCV